MRERGLEKINTVLVVSILRDSNGLAIQNKSYFEEEDRGRGSYLIDF